MKAALKTLKVRLTLVKDDIAGFESENEELRARIDELLSEVPEDEE